eukprot:gene25396-biopygen1448
MTARIARCGCSGRNGAARVRSAPCQSYRTPVFKIPRHLSAEKLLFWVERARDFFFDFPGAQVHVYLFVFLEKYFKKSSFWAFGEAYWSTRLPGKFKKVWSPLDPETALFAGKAHVGHNLPVRWGHGNAGLVGNPARSLTEATARSQATANEHQQEGTDDGSHCALWRLRKKRRCPRPVRALSVSASVVPSGAQTVERGAGHLIGVRPQAQKGTSLAR